MCFYCLQAKCPPGCPNYEPPETSLYCNICGEGIYEGDEYITNDDKENVHWDCICYRRDLAEFLGYEIKTMEK